MYRRVVPGSPVLQRGTPGPEAYSALCDEAADGIRGTAAFSGPERLRFGWDRRYSRDEWLDAVPTFGGHGQFPPDTLEELLAGIGAAIGAAGGSVTGRYATVAVTATATGAP